MDQLPNNARRAEQLLTEALGLLDEREYLVEAAFVQTALDRLRETIALMNHTPVPPPLLGKDGPDEISKLQ